MKGESEILMLATRTPFAEFGRSGGRMQQFSGKMLVQEGRLVINKGSLDQWVAIRYVRPIRAQRE